MCFRYMHGRVCAYSVHTKYTLGLQINGGKNTIFYTMCNLGNVVRLEMYIFCTCISLKKKLWKNSIKISLRHFNGTMSIHYIIITRLVSFKL